MPKPTQEEIDEVLWDYLQAERQDPIRARLNNFADWQMAHDKKDDERHTQTMLAIQSQGYRIATLESKAGNLQEWADTTGRHELETIRAANKRWTDAVWKIAIGVISLLLGAGVMAIIRAGHP